MKCLLPTFLAHHSSSSEVNFDSVLEVPILFFYFLRWDLKLEFVAIFLCQCPDYWGFGVYHNTQLQGQLCKLAGYLSYSPVTSFKIAEGISENHGT